MQGSMFRKLYRIVSASRLTKPSLDRYRRYPIPSLGFCYDSIPFKYDFRELRELKPWLSVIIYKIILKIINNSRKDHKGIQGRLGIVC